MCQGNEMTGCGLASSGLRERQAAGCCEIDNGTLVCLQCVCDLQCVLNLQCV